VRNKAAEICEKYLSKGDKVYVEGRLKNRQWQAEDGTTKYTTEVHVQDFTFLSTKSDGGANQGVQAMNSGATAADPNPVHAPNMDSDPSDDLPF
jgi:single-strand DNA-binding protein